MGFWHFVALAVILAIPSEAMPCSVKHVSTPEELIEQAVVVVRVRVIGKASGATATSYGRVTLQVLEALKGVVSSKMLTVAGYTDKYEGPNARKPPYRSVRPGGQHGNCFAHDYKPGAEFLLFLREGTPYWAPLAAVNEEVSGASDPWVVWVKQALRGTP